MLNIGNLGAWRRNAAAAPAYIIDCDVSSSIPAGVTFTRAATGNTASYFDNSGVMQFVGADVPRFDYDPVTLALKGLLLEPQRTNTCRPSVLNAGAWGVLSASYTASSGTAPDGTNTMALAKDKATSTLHVVYENANATSFTAGAVYVSSIFAKADAGNIIQLTGVPAAFGTTQYSNFDLTTGALGTNTDVTPLIENVGSSVYRCSIQDDANSNATGTSLQVGFTNDNGSATRLPNYSGSTQGSFLWGGQTEIVATGERDGPSSYIHIPSGTTSVTRFAEVLSFTIPSGVATLRYHFDDASTQDVSVSAGAYTVPTNLNRPHIKRFHSLETV